MQSLPPGTVTSLERRVIKHSSAAIMLAVSELQQTFFPENSTRIMHVAEEQIAKNEKWLRQEARTFEQVIASEVANAMALNMPPTQRDRMISDMCDEWDRKTTKNFEEQVVLDITKSIERTKWNIPHSCAPASTRAPQGGLPPFEGKRANRYLV